MKHEPLKGNPKQSNISRAIPVVPLMSYTGEGLAVRVGGFRLSGEGDE